MANITHHDHHDYSDHRLLKGQPKTDILAPLRHWLDSIEFHSSKVARFICRLIPCQCAFERDLTVLGHTYHVPALCKLNPLYNELISLRFRALSYLADVCGEDITQYICE